MKIVFNHSYIPKSASIYLEDALYHSGLNAEKYRKKASSLLSNITGTNTLLTHSGTAALEMAALIIDIKPGDEVIMPSFTFTSTANAFALRGATPIFVDITKDTLNIDTDLIESAITSRTKAIVPVHYAGAGCNMAKILSLAKKYKLFVIEDAAQGLGASLNDQHLGSIGHLGILSFGQAKNITSDQGGALLINDKSLLERAKIIWQRGTNREQFLNGEVDKYTWQDLGSAFSMSETAAAILLSQLEKIDDITKTRLMYWKTYDSLLKEELQNLLLTLPAYSSSQQHNGHLYFILTHSQKHREELISLAKKADIQTSLHYAPLHLSPAGQKIGRSKNNLPITLEIHEKMIRLPLWYGMPIDLVTDRMRAAFKKKLTCN